MKEKTLVLILFVCVASITHAEPTVWYVHPDSVFNSIQNALDSCVDNDIVLVGPGTYYENIIWPSTQGIHLVSELGPDVTVIDGDSLVSVIEIATGVDSTTIVSGFTIQNGYSSDPGLGGGYNCYQSSPTITGNVIAGNTAIQSSDIGFGGGIYCFESSPIIRDNTISENHARIGGGIACQASSPTITGNTINGNVTHGPTPVPGFFGEIGRQTRGDGAGIACWDNSAPIISNNIINANNIAGLAGSGSGIYCHNSAPTISDNTITNNSGAIAGGGGGIHCYGLAPIITGNTITGNTCGGGGGIDCNNSSAIITRNTITLNETRWLTVGGNGGGISCVNNAAPVISNNTIAMNATPYGGYGDGIYCDSSSPIIDSCTISNNYGDGIYCHREANPVISYCNITDNVDYGIRNLYTSVTISAENNWWGDATGPYHPDSNPGGMGDTVSDYVDFIPWLTEPVGVQEKDAIEVERQKSSATIFCGPLRLPADKNCRVFDITGRVVAPDKLRPGIYFLEVEGKITRKVVKVR